ncbi:MAG: hypothetical protein J5758_04670 [Abditibacteriota bacterium]|nr:hypothetical protein [Abditibacteriota bacterium]
MKTTHWYALQVFTSHEDKVKNTLQQKIDALPASEEDRLRPCREDILEVYVPKKTVYRRRDGKTREAEVKLYPGYVFVNANIKKPSVWHVINDTEGVIGFVGSGIMGEPIDDSEIDAIKKSVSVTSDEPDCKLRVGETVKIKSGLFEGYSGIIDEINIHKMEAVLLIDMNGNQRRLTISYDLLEN